jgi:hypothetical protein
MECLVPFAAAERKQLLAYLLIELHVPYDEFVNAQRGSNHPRWENLTFEEAENMIEAAGLALLSRCRRERSIQFWTAHSRMPETG